MIWEKLFSKNKEEMIPYDRERKRPVVRCSICNGEQVAGFKDLQTGKFEEFTLIRDEEELRNFMAKCGVDDIEKEY